MPAGAVKARKRALQANEGRSKPCVFPNWIWNWSNFPITKATTTYAARLPSAVAAGSTESRNRLLLSPRGDVPSQALDISLCRLPNVRAVVK